MSTSDLKSASDSSPTSASESIACSSVPSPSRSRAKHSLPVLRRKITRPVTATWSPVVVVGAERLGVVRVDDLAQRVGARDVSGVRRRARGEQPLALVPAHPHLLGQVVVARAGRIGRTRLMAQRLRQRGRRDGAWPDITCRGRARSGVALVDHPQARRASATARGAVTVAQCSTTTAARLTGGDDRHVAGSTPSSAEHPGRPAPSTWPAKPNTAPDWSASTVFLAITERGVTSSTWRSWAPCAPERLERDLDAGRDRAADVLAGGVDHVERGRRAEVDDDARARRTGRPRATRWRSGRCRPRAGCPSAPADRSRTPGPTTTARASGKWPPTASRAARGARPGRSSSTRHCRRPGRRSPGRRGRAAAAPTRPPCACVGRQPPVRDGPGTVEEPDRRVATFCTTTQSSVIDAQVQCDVEGGGRVGERADREEVDPGLRDLPGVVEGEPAAGLEPGPAGDEVDRHPQLVGGHVVEQEQVGAGVDSLAAPGRPCRPRPGPRTSGNPSRTRRNASATPPAATTWLSLTSASSDERHPVVDPAAAAHGVLLQRPQQRRRLAGVADPRAGAGDGVDPRPGRRRDAGQVAQQVERGPLAGQQRRRRAADAHQDVAGADRVHRRCSGARPRASAPTSGAHHRFGDRQAGDHAVGPRDEVAPRASGPGDRRDAGDVDAAVEVLLERGARRGR